MKSTSLLRVYCCVASVLVVYSCDPQAQRKEKTGIREAARGESKLTADGTVNDYYKDGKLRAEIPYANGKKNGVG